MITCKNCATEFEGEFCPNCGQKAETTRITGGHILTDLRSHFIHFDRGFLFTLVELVKRPGHTIREYLEGKRIRHIKPLQFMLWATGVSFFITHLLGFEERLMAQLEAEQPGSQQSIQASQKLTDFFSNNPSLVMLLIVPTVALCAWLLFRKKQLNYAECFTINLFLIAQISLLNIVTHLIFTIWDNLTIQTMAIVGSIQSLVGILYFGWAYSQFFNHSKKIPTWIKGILTLLGGYAMLTLVISAIFYLFKPQIDAWMAH